MPIIPPDNIVLSWSLPLRKQTKQIFQKLCAFLGGNSVFSVSHGDLQVLPTTSKVFKFLASRNSMDSSHKLFCFGENTFVFSVSKRNNPLFYFDYKEILDHWESPDGFYLRALCTFARKPLFLCLDSRRPFSLLSKYSFAKNTSLDHLILNTSEQEAISNAYLFPNGRQGDIDCGASQPLSSA